MGKNGIIKLTKKLATIRKCIKIMFEHKHISLNPRSMHVKGESLFCMIPKISFKAEGSSFNYCQYALGLIIIISW